MANKEDFKFKIVLVGDTGAGKTSIMCRYLNGTYAANPYIGYLVAKTVVVNQYTVRLELVEIHDNGQVADFSNTDGAIYCCALGPLAKNMHADPSNDFKRFVTAWRGLLSNYTKTPFVQVLVGTKLDLTDENATLATVSKYSNNNFESGLLSVPKYILDHILSYLTLREIGRCSQLNKTWHLTADDCHLWQEMFQECFKGRRVDRPRKHATWKLEYEHQAKKLSLPTDMQQFGKDLNMRCYLTSAKRGTNVDQLFEDMAIRLVAVARAASPNKRPNDGGEGKITVVKDFFKKLFMISDEF